MDDYAYQEWVNFMIMDELHVTVDEISTSNLICFCEDQKAELGFWGAIKLREYKEREGGDRYPDIEGYKCRDYLEYKLLVKILDWIVPFVIMFLNGMLLNYTIKAIKWIKFDSKSEEISKIQSWVFVLTFFNTAIAILLINANFSGVN